MTRSMAYTDRIRMERFKRRLPQWKVAQYLGISQSSYQVYEAGIRPVPLKHQAALIKVLGLGKNFFKDQNKSGEPNDEAVPEDE